MSVLAVTGLGREARIIAGTGVITLASGGAASTLAARIEAVLSPQITAIISIGIAGALERGLKVGDAVVAAGVAGAGAGAGANYPIDEQWAGRLCAALPKARRGLVAGSDTMIVNGAEKAVLHAATQALCVDMETHLAALVAQRRGLPFAVLRFISDDAERALPKAAQAGMKPDGGMDIAAVLKSLTADPRQLSALIRTGIEAEVAFRALLRSRRRVGPTLGFSDV